jgi:hypothetical protein
MRKATNDDTVENRFPRAVIVKNLTCDLTRGDDPLNSEEFTRNRFLNAIDSNRFRYVPERETTRRRREEKKEKKERKENEKKKKKETRLVTLNSFDCSRKHAFACCVSLSVKDGRSIRSTLVRQNVKINVAAKQKVSTIRSIFINDQ